MNIVLYVPTHNCLNACSTYTNRGEGVWAMPDQSFCGALKGGGSKGNIPSLLCRRLGLGLAPVQDAQRIAGIRQ